MWAELLQDTITCCNKLEDDLSRPSMAKTSTLERKQILACSKVRGNCLPAASQLLLAQAQHSHALPPQRALAPCFTLTTSPTKSRTHCTPYARQPNTSPHNLAPSLLASNSQSIAPTFSAQERNLDRAVHATATSGHACRPREGLRLCTAGAACGPAEQSHLR